MKNHPEVLRFRIDGMACGACSARSQRVLNNMEHIDRQVLEAVGQTVLQVIYNENE